MTGTTSAQKTQHPQHPQHPWAHILWRDRLTVLMMMVVMLLIALGLIAYLPRDYVATSIITASPTGAPNASETNVNWGIESDFVRSDAVMNDVYNQLSPVQSTKQFQTFRPLKLPQHMQPAPADDDKNVAHDWQDKLFVFVHNDAQQKPSGLRLEARSSNPAEAAQLAHVVAESYMRARSDIAAKDTAQKNGWIRAELLKKRKSLIEAQAIYTQYYRENGLILSAEKDAATDRAISINEVKAEIAQNAVRYGLKHPIMIELNARLTSLETQIEMDGAQPTLVQQTLDQLMQDVQTARGDLDQFIKQNGAGLSSAPAAPDRILLRADKISIRPDHRFDRALIGIFALCGLLSGMCVVVMRHLIRPTLQSFHDIPRDVASLPRIGVLHPAKDSKHFTDSASIMAFKTMRHDLRLRFKEPKLVVVTSDVDHVTSLHVGLGLARAAAKAGEKSIIIEANWHHAHLHHIAPNHKNRTLIDYVAGSASLESILNRDDPSGTHILYGGDIPMTAVDLLSGTKFSNLLLSFRQIYDLVILIAPPVAQGADTRILSRMADLTLLTMVADGSHPASLSAAVTTLNDAKITDIATLWVG
jgi:Mrp family chromosome partitioning ATPase